MGWDYLVEFPLPHSRTDEPFDSRTKMPDMKVQVKTTWSDKNKIDLELIAAERLARWAYPSFIIILRLDMDITFRDAWLIHIFDERLARILHALRQAEAKGSLSIKSKTISFSTDHGIRLDADGSQLASAMRAAIGKPNDYTTRKIDQLRNLGFEGAPFQGSFSLKASSETEILDVVLGLKTGEATQFSVQEVRFGIPIEKVAPQSVQVKFKPKPQAGELVLLSSGSERRRATLPADVYFASTGIGTVSPYKLRLTSPVLELIGNSEDQKASLNIGAVNNRRYTLDQSIQIARAHQVIASGPCTARVKVGGNEAISFAITDVKLPLTKEQYAWQLKSLTSFHDIIRGIGLTDLELNNDEISSNWDGIRFVLTTQHPNNGLTISFRVTPSGDVPTIPGMLDGLYASSLSFGAVTIAYWATMQVAAKVERDGINLNLSQFSLRDVCAIGPGETFDAFISEASESSGLDFVVISDSKKYDDPSC